MSQGLEYLPLSAACYERPPTPNVTNMSNKQLRRTPKIGHTHFNHFGLPIKRAASEESLKPPSSVSTTATSVSLTPSDIFAMNTVLAQARQNGEIPRTTSSPMDGQAVIEDYGFLTRLREVRGDLSTPASESYTQLRVEVARRIQERDSALSEEETKKEAARRVNSYLKSIEQELFFFDAATASPQSSRSKRSCSSQVDSETFSEEVLSIIEQAADQTLVDATEPLRVDLRCFKQNNETFSRLLQCQEDVTKTLSSMIDPQCKAIQASAENLALLSGLATHLSQVVMNLPLALNQIVSNSVQHHAQTAIRQVMEVQQNSMLLVVEEESRQRKLDHEVLAAKVAECLHAAGEVTESKPKKRDVIPMSLKKMFKW